MGAAHVSKLSVAYEDHTIGRGSREHSMRMGGFYPLGEYVRSGAIPGLNPSDYCSIFCLNEGNRLDSEIDLASNIHPPPAGVPYSAYRMRNAYARAYDLLTAMTLSYDWGMDTLDLERSFSDDPAFRLLPPMRFSATPPEAGQFGGVTPPVLIGRSNPVPYPLSEEFDGLVLLRRFDSWAPTNDPFYIPRRRFGPGGNFSDRPSEYFVPSVDGSEENWLAQWELIRPDLQWNSSDSNPDRFAGLFGGQGEDSESLRYRRVTSVIPFRVVADPPEILLQGYGFEGREGDRGSLSVVVKIATVRGDPTRSCVVQTQILSDRILAVRISRSFLLEWANASSHPVTRNNRGERVLRCDVKVVFPETLQGGGPYTCTLHDAMDVVFP
jgi:hypothetical protein